jgi:hypothetical protein
MIAHFVKLVSLLDVSPFSPTAVSLEEFLRVYHALNSLNMVDHLAWEFATMADKSLCEQDLGKDGVIVLYSAGVGFSETLRENYTPIITPERRITVAGGVYHC